ncbi:MAG: YbaN family protein [Pseudomonadota bacterium]
MSPRQIVWLLFGLAALGLGALGAVLPLLPTTPFVILAAFAFSKSSPRLERWLLSSRTFGPLIIKWREEGAIAPRHKLIGIVAMLIVLSASVAMQIDWRIIALQAMFMAIGAIYVLSRPNGD